MDEVGGGVAFVGRSLVGVEEVLLAVVVADGEGVVDKSFIGALFVEQVEVEVALVGVAHEVEANHPRRPTVALNSTRWHP